MNKLSTLQNKVLDNSYQNIFLGFLHFYLHFSFEKSSTVLTITGQKKEVSINPIVRDLLIITNKKIFLE